MSTDPRPEMFELEPLPKVVSVETPETLASTAWKAVFFDTTEGTLDHVVVFTFRERTGRMWRLRGRTLPAADDEVRALVRREQAEAVAVAHEVPVPPGVEATRTMCIAVEAPRGKHDLLLALKGRVGQYRILFQSYPIDAERRWLGNAPTREVAGFGMFDGFVAAVDGEA